MRMQNLALILAALLTLDQGVQAQYISASAIGAGANAMANGSF